MAIINRSSGLSGASEPLIQRLRDVVALKSQLSL